MLCRRNGLRLRDRVVAFTLVPRRESKSSMHNASCLALKGDGIIENQNIRCDGNFGGLDNVEDYAHVSRDPLIPAGRNSWWGKCAS